MHFTGWQLLSCMFCLLLCSQIKTYHNAGMQCEPPRKVCAVNRHCNATNSLLIQTIVILSGSSKIMVFYYSLVSIRLLHCKEGTKDPVGISCHYTDIFGMRVSPSVCRECLHTSRSISVVKYCTVELHLFLNVIFTVCISRLGWRAKD